MEWEAGLQLGQQQYYGQRGLLLRFQQELVRWILLVFIMTAQIILGIFHRILADDELD